MVSYYEYEELRKKALNNGTQEDIDNLGEWFSKYGTIYWNGEYYNLDDGFKLYPVYKEKSDDEFELVGYEIKEF